MNKHSIVLPLLIILITCGVLLFDLLVFDLGISNAVFIVLFPFVIIYCTVLYIKDLKKGKDSFIRKTGRWIRDLFDASCGL